jgi:hypothetical protein
MERAWASFRCGVLFERAYFVPYTSVACWFDVSVPRSAVAACQWRAVKLAWARLRFGVLLERAWLFTTQVWPAA